MNLFAFIIESTICLLITYGFYYLFLRRMKTFTFNRYYLLFSMLYAITIPFLQIGVVFLVPITGSIPNLDITGGSLVRGEVISGSPARIFGMEGVLITIYIVVTVILFSRFSFNLLKLVLKTRKAVTVDYLRSKLVLVEERTLPYSFFNFIVLNRSDYGEGRIEKELLIHEQAHCQQNHSADILAVELLKIFLWFNPILWLFKNAIQLNHEYLADHKVLSTYNRDNYQRILVNLTLRNSTAYLASDFNYSLTKKRLVMMTIKHAPDRATLKKIAVVPLFIFLGITLTFSQEANSDGTLSSIADEWWYPILKRHNIKPAAFNNFEQVFEMGSTNEITDGVVTLKDALFLVKNQGDDYTFIRSPLAYHDLEKNIIKGETGTIELFRPMEGGTDPVETIQCQKFKYRIEENLSILKADQLKIRR